MKTAMAFVVSVLLGIGLAYGVASCSAPPSPDTHEARAVGERVFLDTPRAIRAYTQHPCWKVVKLSGSRGQVYAIFEKVK